MSVLGPHPEFHKLFLEKHNPKTAFAKQKKVLSTLHSMSRLVPDLMSRICKDAKFNTAALRTLTDYFNAKISVGSQQIDSDTDSFYNEDDWKFFDGDLGVNNNDADNDMQLCM
jgi:hypothetical protein